MLQEIFQLILLVIIYTLIFYNKAKLSKFLKLVDYPDNKRKIHLKPTPLLGGIIILLLILINFNSFRMYLPEKELLLLFSLVGVYFSLSYIDDIKGLNSYFRLTFLFFVTYFLLSFSDLFVLKNLAFDYKNLNYSLGYFEIFVSTLCILLLVNALNLSDGINGLSILLIIFWLSYIKLVLFKDISPLGLSSLIILIIMFFHIFKGKFFLGDYGVTVAALVISLLAIASYNINQSTTKHIYVEELFLLFFVPGLDMFRLFIYRIIKKKDPFSADKNHLHHILIAKFDLKTTLLLYLVISVAPLLLFKFFLLNTVVLITTCIVVYFLVLNISIKKYF
tara:strand:- start:882 stop:1886 length:1005 start_codon:yes stop_codon:yes gene_type:complete